MFLRARNFLFIGLLSIISWAVAAPVQAQVAVVRVKSIDALMADVKYILTMAGQKDRADQLEGLVNAFTAGQGFAGLDTKRPLGVFVVAPEGPTIPPVVGFIPISKKQEFLDFLKQINFEATKEGDLYALELPNIPKLYLHFANDYLYVSNETSTLKGKLPDAAKLAPTMTNGHTLVNASIRFDEIPNEYKQLFLQLMEQGFEQERAKAGDKTGPAQYANVARLELAKKTLVRLVEESKEVSIGLEVDQHSNQLALDFALVAKPGSKLAAECTEFGKVRSIFAGIAKDAAVGFLVRVPLPEDVRAIYAQLFDQASKETLAKESDATKRAYAEKFLKAVEPTAKSDVIDLGVALRGPHDDKTYTFVAALKVKEGKKIDDLAREVAPFIPSGADGVTISLDHAQHAGAQIHLVKLGFAEQNADAKRVLGAPHVYIVIRDDLILVTAGSHGLAAIKDCLDGVGKPSATAVAPIQLDVSIKKLAALVQPGEEKVADALRKVFTGPQEHRDKVRLTIQGGEAFRIRIELNAEIVKFAAALSPLGTTGD